MTTTDAITISEIAANGMTFRCREAGTAGESVILLHGFPETSHMWTDVMARLAAAGYRCLAPDQRGYSPGARPEGTENYSVALLVADVLALAAARGYQRFHLIGHDWGSGVGWAAASAVPGPLLSWTALSVPHVAAFARAIAEDADQQQRSQYITWFQAPGVAEQALLADDCAQLKSIWTASKPEEVKEYVSVFSQPGALTAALNWYRAAFGGRAEGRAQDAAGEVKVPSLTIWGNQDQAIGRRSTELAAEYLKGPYRFVEMDAGHWLIQEKPAEVTREILAHLKANAASK